MKLFETSDTKFGLESASSSLFVFTVAAINVLGAGEESDITSEFCGASVFVQISINLETKMLFPGILTQVHPCL